MVSGFDEVAVRLGAQGCTEEEIAQVEADQGVRLPESYRHMLRAMGRDTGGLFVGSDVAFPALLGVRDGAVELFEENGIAHLLPPTAVVVMLHQGYIAWFLDTAEGEDPPVRQWGEGNEDGHDAAVVAPDLLTWVLEHERAGSGPVADA